MKLRGQFNGEVKCVIWHSWTTVYETTVTAYQQCSNCASRRVVQRGDGYQPIDYEWLVNGQNALSPRGEFWR